MTKHELCEACDIARSDRDLTNVDISLLDGYGLPGFVPVTVPVEAVARVIRWQCFLFNGGIDSTELNDLAGHFRRKVTVL